MTRYLVFPVVILMSVMLFLTTGGLPVLFDPGSPAATHVSPRYIEKSYKETGSPNFVTAILADYRGYDTLGETTVIFTAGLATVLMLLAFRRTECRPEGEEK